MLPLPTAIFLKIPIAVLFPHKSGRLKETQEAADAGIWHKIKTNYRRKSVGQASMEGVGV